MMSHIDTPWIGLVALIAMFVLPFLPGWVFDGPRTVKHHPRRHVCAECGAPWADGHSCESDSAPGDDLLYWELRRPSTSTLIMRRPRQLAEPDD
jgi:hypothetical protein